MKRPALFQQQKQRCQLTLSSQFSLHHISICKGQGQAWWGFLFRESSLQIKWDSFIVKEGRGKKERKSCRIYLMEKSYFSGEGSSADNTSWRLGASCACAPLSHPINCGQNDLGFTLSLHFIQLGLCHAFLHGKDRDSPTMMWIRGFPRALSGAETGSSILALVPVMDSQPTGNESREGRDI